MDALARTPGTHLHRALGGDDWTLDQHLLALAVDALAVANWQRSKDGGKPSKRPKPISPLAKKSRRKKVGNAGGRTPQQVVTLLALYRSGAFDAGG